MTERTKSQNGRRSRAKGHAFERWVVAELHRVGLPAERNISQVRTAAREGCDVEGSEWWIECKVGAKPDHRAAHAQASADRDRRDEDERPVVVVWKRDRHEAMATCSLGDISDGGERAGAGPLVTMRFAEWLEMAAPAAMGGCGCHGAASAEHPSGAGPMVGHPGADPPAAGDGSGLVLGARVLGMEGEER